MTSSAGSLFVRLYLDEDVHKGVVTALTLRGFDVKSAHARERRGLPDEEQLATAADEGRALVTFNTADYVRLHIEWLRTGRAHAGIVVSDQLSVRDTVRRLLNLLNRVAPDDMQNQLWWLQAFRS